MAARIRDTNWINDKHLEDTLRKLVGDNLKRTEILDYMQRDFPEYAWSLRTLDRRLRYFNIYKTDKNVSAEEIQRVVLEEISGPGRLLGYRAMHAKIRQYHQLNVPRALVYAAMEDVDTNGFEYRTVEEKSKREKGGFTSEGTNWVFSLDGHDKLMGFQNSTFPITIYGCLDTDSRNLVWIKVWDSNNSPYLIACWYFDYLYESKLLLDYVRLGKRTETGVLGTMHAYLRRQKCDIDTDDEACDIIIYGPSTSNEASIRRFYISFKQTWNKRLCIVDFFAHSVFMDFLFMKIPRRNDYFQSKKR